MKSLLSLLTATILTLLATSSVFAHAGPPFILIDNQATTVNSIYSSGNKLRVASEIAPKKYLVNQPIAFGVDRSLLTVDPSLIGESNFNWDFGDGSKLNGLNSTHTFKKTGSFIVTLKAKDPTYGNEVDLEVVRVDVLPSPNYSLPKALIKVDGKLIKNPIEDVIQTTVGQEHSFDGSESVGEGLTYQWDFGDGSDIVSAAQTKHTLKFEGIFNYSIFPLLRVTDKNGLVADNYVQISNDPGSANSNESTQSAKTNTTDLKNYIWVPIALGVVIVAIGLASRKFLKKKDAA